MDANSFTWFQRGAIDHTLGVTFSESPAPDLFEREEWEKGWLAAEERHQKILVRVAATASNRVLASLRRKS